MGDQEFEKTFRGPLTDRVVHVTLPADVAFDLDQFGQVQKEILGRLGCPGCCSGFDIRWDFARRFMVKEDHQIEQLG